jgi:hypothetical protein
VGESQSRPYQLSFNRFLRVAFQGSRVTSDGGLILVRELDERFALSELSRITLHDQAEWQKGSIEDWVMEGRRLAQTVAYGDLSNENPAPIPPEYERQAEPVIELQLEKAGVRLAYLLNADLMLNAAGQKPESRVHTALSGGNPDVRVWVNTNSGAYHCPGTRWFGKTHEGHYMTQKEAQEKGYHPAANRPCL